MKFFCRYILNGKIVVCCALLCLPFYLLFRNVQTNIQQHIAFISATYFSNSTIYSPNTIVILFNTQWAFKVIDTLECETLNADNKNVKSLATVRMAFEKIPLCNWTTFIAICPASIINPTTLKLSIQKSTHSPATVPLRYAIQKKLEVVACFSPLFYNERWQLLFSTLEIYRQNGVNLQVFYIQSIREELFNLLKKYEKLGVAAIESWVLIDLGNKAEKDPNAELAWRNQAAAHTDCFLKYREAADFIIVADIDDILFPKIGDNYAKEFRHLSLQYPNAAGFLYNRTHVEVSAHTSPVTFSLENFLNSIKATNTWGSGKSVVIPSRVQTVWLHWPIIIEKGYKLIEIPNDANIMLHFRNWNITESFVNDTENASPKLFEKTFNLQAFLNSSNFDQLSNHGHAFIIKNALNEYEMLSSEIVYYPLIEKCYFDIFYSTFQNGIYNPDMCPGPKQCTFPAFPGISCIISKRNYEHSKISSEIKLHYSQTEDSFFKSADGCRM